MLLLLSLCALAANLSGRYLDPLVTGVARDFAVAPGTAALIASAFTLPFGLSQPLLGPVGDALGKTAVFRACLWLLAVALTASVFAASLPLLFATRVLAGFAAAGIIPIGLAMLGDAIPPGERQVAFARFSGGAIVGQLVGLTASGALAEAVGWRASLWLPAGFSLAAALGASLRLKPGAAEVRRPLRLRDALARYGALLHSADARLCYATVFVEGVCIYGPLPFIVGLLEARGAGGPREAGFVVAGLGLGCLLLSLVIRPVVRAVGPRNMMRLGGVLAGTGLTGLAAGPASWLADAGLFLVVGFGYFMLHNALQGAVMELAPGPARSSAVSLHYFSFFIGQAAGPVTFGLGLAAAGGGFAFVAAALVLAAAGLVLAWRLRQPAPIRT